MGYIIHIRITAVCETCVCMRPGEKGLPGIGRPEKGEERGGQDNEVIGVKVTSLRLSPMCPPLVPQPCIHPAQPCLRDLDRGFVRLGTGRFRSSARSVGGLTPVSPVLRKGREGRRTCQASQRPAAAAEGGGAHLRALTTEGAVG